MWNLKINATSAPPVRPIDQCASGSIESLDGRVYHVVMSYWKRSNIFAWFPTRWWHWTELDSVHDYCLKDMKRRVKWLSLKKKNVAFSFKKNEQVWIYQEYIFLFVFFFFFIILLVHCTISMIDTHLVYYNNWNEDPVDMPYTTSHQNPTLE